MKPYAWVCRKCNKFDFADTKEQLASPEHVSHRGVDIGSCNGQFIALYTLEQIDEIIEEIKENGMNEQIKQIYYLKECDKIDESRIMTKEQFDAFKLFDSSFPYSEYDVYKYDAIRHIGNFNKIVMVMSHVDLVMEEDFEKQKEEIKNRKGFIKFLNKEN